MAESQNGYSVLGKEDVKHYTVVPGLSLPLRPDAAGYVLAHFLRRYDSRVEPLGKTETFGWAPRKIAGSDEWSNHASGTAVDANASQHKQGQAGTFTAAELNNLDELLDEYDDVIRWGGTFRTTKDEMHFEINQNYAAVRLLARMLRRNGRVVLSRLKPGNRNLDVYMVKRALKKKGFYTGQLTNFFGKGLQNAYADYQRSLGYDGADADGLPGVSSLESLGFTVKEG